MPPELPENEPAPAEQNPQRPGKSTLTFFYPAVGLRTLLFWWLSGCGLLTIVGLIFYFVIRRRDQQRG